MFYFTRVLHPTRVSLPLIFSRFRTIDEYPSVINRLTLFPQAPTNASTAPCTRGLSPEDWPARVLGFLRIKEGLWTGRKNSISVKNR